MLFQLWPAGWQQTLVSKGLNCLSSYLNEDGSDDEEEVGEHKDLWITSDSLKSIQVILFSQMGVVSDNKDGFWWHWRSSADA